MSTNSIANHFTADESPIVRRRQLFDIVFGPLTSGFAVIALLLSFVLPCEGLGIPVCWIKSYWDVQCPGCGLTRSVTCISHFEFVKAWNYHPFGLLVYALFVANVAVLLIPKSRREKLKNSIAQCEGWLKPCYLLIVVSFLTYGCIRVLLSMTAV